MARKAVADKTPATVAEVRAWARGNGLDVGQRGRIKADVFAAYTAETGRPAGAKG